MTKLFRSLALLLFFTPALLGQTTEPVKVEKHLKNIRQLTFGGNNAEAYWSPNSKSVTFQSDFAKWGGQCDQIFRMDVKKAAKDTAYRPPMVSTSLGRTTCSYFMPDGNMFCMLQRTKAEMRVLHRHRRILKSIYGPFTPILTFLLLTKKGKITKQLTNTEGYDAEATVSPDGKKNRFHV